MVKMFKNIGWYLQLQHFKVINNVFCGSLNILNILTIYVSYAFYPAKNRFLPDFMYPYDCQTYCDPNIHTAPMT